MSRGDAKRSPYSVLTWSYAIALSVVGLLFVGAYLLLDRAIDKQRDVALAVQMASTPSPPQGRMPHTLRPFIWGPSKVRGAEPGGA